MSTRSVVVEIAKATDATSFLSTATLLVGVFVVVTGTALVQLILSSSDVEIVAEPQDRTTQVLGVLIFVTLIDIIGLGFPLWVLYEDTLGSVSARALSIAMIFIVVVVVVNLILPLYVIMLYRGARAWVDLSKLLDHVKRIEEFDKLRDSMIDGRFLTSELRELLEKKAPLEVP